MNARSRTRGLREFIARVLLATLGAAAVGCGDVEPGRNDAESRPRAADTASTGPQTPDPSDGRLTTSSGTVITDFGDRSDRLAAVRSLIRLQRDFRANRMRAACTRINDFLLSQFTPPGTQADTPCKRKLEVYAIQRAKRDTPQPQMRLLWVRSYGTEAGIWVEARQSRRVRIQLRSSPDGTWQYDLGSLMRPDVLAAELAGARDYGLMSRK